MKRSSLFDYSVLGVTSTIKYRYFPIPDGADKNLKYVITQDYLIKG